MNIALDDEPLLEGVLPLVDRIRNYQRRRPDPKNEPSPPMHKPEMLLIGCVDARVDPVAALRIPSGKALIYRKIAALVKKGDEEDEATLEFAINVKKVRDIVVMGHTDCGGVDACLHHDDAWGVTGALRRFLQPLYDALSELFMVDTDPKHQAREMECEAVRESLENLKSYKVVADAIADGRIRLHGWVINTGTQIISEMNDEGAFIPMNRSQNHVRIGPISGAVLGV